MKMTRRGLAAALVAPVTARAQPVRPDTPEEELAAARKRVQTSIDAVRKFQIAPAVEPDFTFRA
jgi:hypothetical protein